MVRAHVMITGRVQGVYYRSYTVDMARALGIKGWVRNTMGGRVEALFEGEEQAVQEMVEWCWTGSPSSRVEGVEVTWGEATGEFESFSVTYGMRGRR
jgi:acylphosphatase